MNTTTTNFTRLGKFDGSVANVTVTIGYDAPWRQVHALLLMGAERTANLRKSPAALCRAARAVRLLCRVHANRAPGKREAPRIETLSNLHANIQDAFNEFGVQIMSPHFMMQPQQNIVVPRSKWHAAPATKESDGAAASSLPDKDYSGWT